MLIQVGQKWINRMDEELTVIEVDTDTDTIWLDVKYSEKTITRYAELGGRVPMWSADFLLFQLVK